MSQAAIELRDRLQAAMDKLDPTLRIENVDLFYNVFIVRDHNRMAQGQWKLDSQHPDDRMPAIKDWFDRKRKQHPESYATCSCHAANRGYITNNRVP